MQPSPGQVRKDLHYLESGTERYMRERERSQPFSDAYSRSTYGGSATSAQASKETPL